MSSIVNHSLPQGSVCQCDTYPEDCGVHGWSSEDYDGPEDAAMAVTERFDSNRRG